MTNNADDLQRQIAALQLQLVALQVSPPPYGPEVNTPTSSHDMFIATQQFITFSTTVYGVDPSAAQREQLERYLRRLAAKMQRLPLMGLAPRLDDGDGVGLPQVYVMLATDNHIQIASVTETGVRHYFADDALQHLKPEFDPDYALPPRAIINAGRLLLATQQDDLVGTHTILSRAQLATEAVYGQQHLVLLGEPGGGKSTFLRHLAWALAQRGLGQMGAATTLFGWNDTTTVLPLLLPLRTLAERLATEGSTPATVSATLRDELTRAYDVRDADTLLERVFDHGAALLLLDGLDEVPLASAPGVADRLMVLRAVRDFAALYGTTRVVLTCRVRAFDAVLRACLGWPGATIAPLTLGQMRHFVSAWYDELVRRDALGRAPADRQRDDMIAVLTDPQRPRLREMAQTPLLLTMMVLVRAETGALPRDRALLYERIMEQLLGAWDQAHGGHSLAQVIGDARVQSETLRPLFDRLCYEAHLHATAADGRGRLAGNTIQLALTTFFAQIKVPGAWEAAQRCVIYFHERSGLLLPEEQHDTFALAHLTLQEHGAGRHMLLDPHVNAVAMVMQHRAEDHWREPIALGLGVIHTTQPSAADRIDRVLTEFIDPDEHGTPKEHARWYRDLIFAAELGAERDWDLLRPLGIGVDRLQRDLRRGLVALLGDVRQPLPVNERVRAGLLLGDLHDPRFPVTRDAWLRELAKVHAGDTSGYFCRVPAGIYRLGRNADALDADAHELSSHNVTLVQPVWIARFPITNQQWQHWRTTDGYQPSGTDDLIHTHPNQPVVAVPWAAAQAFCQWLSTQLAAAIRLPMEDEWEAAARGLDERSYPWGNERLRDRAAIKADDAERAWSAPVPVGCYPAGASPVGALDMAGNIWEWTTPIYGPHIPTLRQVRRRRPRGCCGGAVIKAKRVRRA